MMGSGRKISWMLLVGGMVAPAAFMAEAKPGDPPASKPPTIKKAEIPSRQINFDTTQSMGLVSVRRVGAMGQEPWQKLGKATGKVRVPQGFDLRLDVDPKFTGGLGALDSLASGDLQMINAAGLSLGDADLSHIAKFTGMRILNLRKNPIGDAGLAHLAAMTAMETLYLDDTLVTDAGLDQLKGMRTLFHLNLADTAPMSPDRAARITDAGIARIAHLNTLVFLDLEGSGVTDAGLARLSEMRGLYSLNLNGAPLTNNAIQQTIRGFAGLTELGLRGTAVEDSGVKLLSGLTGLHKLNLSGTKTTEAALESLARLPGLGDLDISRTFILSPVGAEQLMKMKSLEVLTVHPGQLAPDLVTQLKTAFPRLQIRETAN